MLARDQALPKFQPYDLTGAAGKALAHIRFTSLPWTCMNTFQPQLHRFINIASPRYHIGYNFFYFTVLIMQ